MKSEVKIKKVYQISTILPWAIITVIVSLFMGIVTGWTLNSYQNNLVKSEAHSLVQTVTTKWISEPNKIVQITEVEPVIVKDCSLTNRYDWDKKIAYAVCMAESGGNHLAYGDGSTAYPSIGLMQIRMLPGRPSKEQLEDPEFNMQYAYNMWKNQGFRPWSAYKSNSYTKYL